MMKMVKGILIVIVVSFCLAVMPCLAEVSDSDLNSATLKLSQSEEPQEPEEDFEDWEEDEEGEDQIADPIEPVNRAFFHFNDKLYFWLLKPAATGYKWVVPGRVRISVRNFFSNITMPIRAVNCLLQGKFKGFGNELLRFTVNSTAGFFGTHDVAKSSMGIDRQDEDFGQTLGVYGLGPGFYINWPVFGPSSVRGTFGLVGDYFLDPVSYVEPRIAEAGIKAEDRVNSTSLTLGEYEDLKEAAIDPYVALRDAYYQYRQNRIKE